MSTAINIQGNAIQSLKRLSKVLKDDAQRNRAVAEAAVPVFQKHFRGMSSSNKNRLGARGGFWNRMLSSTVPVGTSEAAVVRMPREIALRYFGGTVTPKGGAKYLTIPARTEAYGKSARDFNDLRFVPFKSGAKALVQRAQTRVSYRKDRKTGKTKAVRGRERGGLVFYWLVPSATIRGDKAVLPSDDQVITGVRRGIDGYLRRNS
jgi:hypothetical protein